MPGPSCETFETINSQSQAFGFEHTVINTRDRQVEHSSMARPRKVRDKQKTSLPFDDLGIPGAQGGTQLKATDRGVLLKTTADHTRLCTSIGITVVTPGCQRCDIVKLHIAAGAT